MNWEEKYSASARCMKPSAVREILKLLSQPDIISFAGGMPSSEAFPVEIIKKIAVEVLSKEGDKALQYGISEGDPLLRQYIGERMKKFGFLAEADNILITAGSQHAIDIITRVLVDPGDSIIIEAPSYITALVCFKNNRVNLESVPLDDEGMRMDLLEEKIKSMKSPPKFIYTVPTFQNPAGVTMGIERRKRLVEISKEYGVPIVEDDPYAELRYSGKEVPAVKAFDTEENVVYLGTFSKVFAPGMRLAWMAGEKSFIRKCVIARQSADVCTNTFGQKIVYEYCLHYLDAQILKIKAIYSKKRLAMLEALDQHMPQGVQWTKPEGGMFLWMTLPDGLSAVTLFPKAVERKVAFVDGTGFYNGGGENHIRLNFSYPSVEQIREGIKRLSEVIREEMAKR